MLELTNDLEMQPNQEVPMRNIPFAFGMLQEFQTQLAIDILKRRNAGDSFGRIAHALNKLEIPSEYGGRWYAATVRNVFLRARTKTD
jgi:hypothetical protein